MEQMVDFCSHVLRVQKTPQTWFVDNFELQETNPNLNSMHFDANLDMHALIYIYIYVFCSQLSIKCDIVDAIKRISALFSSAGYSIVIYYCNQKIWYDLEDNQFNL